MALCTDFRGLDFSISWIHSNSELLGGEADDTVVLSVAKGFSLSE